MTTSDLWQQTSDTFSKDSLQRQIYGVAIGIVTNNQDPQNLGRVKVKFPWLDEQIESNWIRIAAPMAGKGRGVYFLPEVEDEVLLIFEHGDIRFPYIIGGLWNGQDQPPIDNQDGKNNIRLIKSRSGQTIRLDDSEGQEKIEIFDKNGENKITWDTANQAITITAAQDITLTATQGTIKLNAKTIEMQATGEMKLQGQPINLN